MKAKAFTLVESLIVLFITAIIIAFFSPQMTKSRQRAIENEFFQRVETEWSKATTRARETGEPCRITIQNQRMCFGKRESIALPKTLKPTCFGAIQIGEDGFVSPQTEEFTSEIDDRIYRLKIQMGWGGFKLEQEAS
ncbi:prepilin-type N-terminal cleavage/methylation domain-containing protein [Limosilactobacillus sp.]|uniref:prepilin-type N-terminal cleavage/methylation domain-containing protein n=1 Tax=Limosilactobacillus sp. TaxID=2773925 RepID=UPI00345E5D3F